MRPLPDRDDLPFAELLPHGLLLDMETGLVLLSTPQQPAPLMRRSGLGSAILPRHSG